MGTSFSKKFISEIRLIALIEDADLPEDVKGIFKEMVKTYKNLQKKARELTKKLRYSLRTMSFARK